MIINMSASKKKVTQDELRRLMNEQKQKLLNNVKKIESPLARYDKDGVLTCIVCNHVVRNEAVWSVHLNSKAHRQNILEKVKRREAPPSPPPVDVSRVSKLKRPAPPPIPVCTKKVKSILKNAPPALKPSVVPSDFFDPETEPQGNDKVKIEDPKEPSSESEPEAEEVTNGEVLPEGFFDDPKLDAKVRNVEYKDPIEEEWEQFQKEIKEETSKAQQIIAEDQEEATTERQIDEIDEQIRNWSRVVNLEKKKQEVITAPAPQKQTGNEENSSDDEAEFEEFLDWRAKKSFV